MKTTSFLALSLAAIITACDSPKNTDDLQANNESDTIATEAPGEKWSKEKAASYYANFDWLSGANFQPSSAINQLEMWQAESFDPETMDRELGMAADIGFNAMRVYLHHLAWEVDPDGFKDRMGKYLNIADKHNISTMFVFFDDCWNPTYTAGVQPAPKPGIHNSGWVRDPGDVQVSDSLLEAFVKDVMGHFSEDPRIVLWDLYNEPGNSGYGNESMPLLKNVFSWAREVNPAQPLSVGVWNLDLKELNKFQVENSDLITYHNYMEPEIHEEWIDSLKTFGRPMICTEYMARTRGNTFQNTMPMLKEHNIGAINWGLVSGKTNTIYAWDTPIENGDEPELWFHDVFRKDGTPYSEEEVNTIKSLNEFD